MRQWLPPPPFLLSQIPIPVVEDCDLFINSNVSVGPPGPPGPIGPPGGCVSPTTLVDSKEYSATIEDCYIGVMYLGDVQIILPVSNAGKIYIIKDAGGEAHKHKIDIVPTNTTIDGEVDYTIKKKYDSVSIVYNGLEWSII